MTTELESITKEGINIDIRPWLLRKLALDMVAIGAPLEIVEDYVTRECRLLELLKTEDKKLAKLYNHPLISCLEDGILTLKRALDNMNTKKYIMGLCIEIVSKIKKESFPEGAKPIERIKHITPLLSNKLEGIGYIILMNLFEMVEVNTFYGNCKTLDNYITRLKEDITTLENILSSEEKLISEVYYSDNDDNKLFKSLLVGRNFDNLLSLFKHYKNNKEKQIIICEFILSLDSQ